MNNSIKTALFAAIFSMFFLFTGNLYSWCSDYEAKDYSNFTIEKYKGYYYVWDANGNRITKWYKAKRGEKNRHTLWVESKATQTRKGSSLISEWVQGWIAVCIDDDGIIDWHWIEKQEKRDEDPLHYLPRGVDGP